MLVAALVPSACSGGATSAGKSKHGTKDTGGATTTSTHKASHANDSALAESSVLHEADLPGYTVEADSKADSGSNDSGDSTDTDFAKCLGVGSTRFASAGIERAAYFDVVFAVRDRAGITLNADSFGEPFDRALQLGLMRKMYDRIGTEAE